MCLGLLFLQFDKAGRRRKLGTETLFAAGGGFLELLDLGEGLVGLALCIVETGAQLLLGTGEGVDGRLGLFVLALQLGDAGALLLAQFERLVALRLELGLEPLIVLAGECQLLLQRLLTELGAAGRSLGGLDLLLEGGDFLVEFQDLLVLGLQLFGELGVGRRLGLEDGEGIAVGGFEGGVAAGETLDFGLGIGARGLDGLELVFDSSAGGF